MRRNFILLIIWGVLIFLSGFTYAEEKSNKRILVIRQAKQDRKTTVAVEAYLINDILEVTVIARMYAAKPRIYNVILVGPKLGRISPKTRKTLLSTIEEEAPFPTSERRGFISFSKKTKNKKAKGTLTKELVKFEIPTEKIIPDRRYQLWIKVESMRKGGKIQGFKFNLENFPKLISQ
jgi:hypothetical protein